jgi:endonuclease/exonuclease/phosphatase family metal-dependent hydrolase
MGLSSSRATSSQKTVSVLTWNVWFDLYKQSERYNDILRVCDHYKPDVICFQEVTQNFMKFLLQHNIMKDYDCSDNGSCSTIGRYGVLSLAKKSLSPSFEFSSFPTHMGRKLLVTKFSVQNEMFAVGNVHLESLNSQELREQQLGIAAQVLRHYPHYMLCGDFNFCSYRNYDLEKPILENLSLKTIIPEFEDVWEKLQGNEPVYTFNGKKNRLVSDSSECMRYDRICSYFSNPNYRPVSIEMLDQPVMVPAPSSSDQLIPLVASSITGEYFVYPSDHFGLFAVFKTSEEDDSMSMDSPPVHEVVQATQQNVDNKSSDNIEESNTK